MLALLFELLQPSFAVLPVNVVEILLHISPFQNLDIVSQHALMLSFSYMVFVVVELVNHLSILIKLVISLQLYQLAANSEVRIVPVKLLVVVNILKEHRLMLYLDVVV